MFCKHQYRVGNLSSVHFRATSPTSRVVGRNDDGGGSVEVRVADTGATTCRAPLENVRLSGHCLRVYDDGGAKNGIRGRFIPVLVWFSVNVH